MNGDRLAEIRKRQNMNKKEFAAHIGMKYTTYNGYETGEREPGSDFLILISRLFNVSIDWLLGIQDAPEIRNTHDISVSEYEITRKYRALDEHGKKIVDMVLDEEHSRMMLAEQSEKAEADYLLPIAAHKHEGATSEELTEDVDMVENDKI